MTQEFNLGGTIQLAGFGEIDRNSLTIVKKMVENYVKRIEGKCKNFESLRLTMKALQRIDKQIKKFELKGQVIDDGKVYPSEVTDHNLFVGLGNLLEKIEKQLF